MGEKKDSVEIHLNETVDVRQHDDNCAYCSDFTKNPSAACKATGRRERVECEYFSEDNRSKSKRERSYRSCKRIKREEEMLVVQLQVFCALLSFISLRSVRREKMKSISLFDQRAMRRRPSPVSITEIQQAENGFGKETSIEDNG